MTSLSCVWNPPTVWYCLIYSLPPLAYIILLAPIAEGVSSYVSLYRTASLAAGQEVLFITVVQFHVTAGPYVAAN